MRDFSFSHGGGISGEVDEAAGQDEEGLACEACRGSSLVFIQSLYIIILLILSLAVIRLH